MFVRRMQPFGAQRALGNDLAQTEGVAPERLAVLHREQHGAWPRLRRFFFGNA